MAINAQIPPSSGGGGIETVLRALTSLGDLDGNDEYVFISHWDGAEWLEPLLNDRQTIVKAPHPENQYKHTRRQQIGRFVGQLLPALYEVKQLLSPLPEIKFEIPASGGFYESLGCDVIHFPYQDFVRCEMPAIYNPHDLQHVHLPDFFEIEERLRRDTVYSTACRTSDTVVVASQYVKQDIVDHFGIEAEKIQVISWAPPAISLREIPDKEANTVFEKYQCPSGPYMLYPAMTWEHKNHIRLLEAIALLRDRDGIGINLICTGHRNSNYSRIEKRVSELNLQDRIRFTGIVEYKELEVFYRKSLFVIIPTLFEAASAPLFEAWQHGVPAACSSVTSLPEQAGEAALIFDPLNVSEITDVIKKLILNDGLREDLQAHGFARLKIFDIAEMAKSYRAVYRRAAGIALSEEDRQLLIRK